MTVSSIFKYMNNQCKFLMPLQKTDTTDIPFIYLNSLETVSALKEL